MSDETTAAKLAAYNLAVDMLNENGEGDSEAYVIPDYSGRGMYGSTTPAIVFAGSTAKVGVAVTVAIVELNNAGELYPEFLWEKAMELVPTRKDNMGRSDYVFY